MSCFGADLIQSVELDEPFFDDVGVNSLELLTILATIESRLGTEGGTLTSELGTRAPPSIRSLIAFVEEAVARKTE
jgi:acyl carrier protein